MTAPTDNDQRKRELETLYRFAAAEGWAVGPLWHAVGPDLIFARWALDNGYNVSQIRDHLQAPEAKPASAPAASGPFSQSEPTAQEKGT